MNMFPIAHAHVAEWEGTDSDHPSDSGGVTRFGISLTFLRGLAAEQKNRDVLDRMGLMLPITATTVRTLTSEQALCILRWEFWEKPRLHEMPPLIALCLYDFGVNAGMGQAALTLQEAINVLLPGSITKLAANVGPLTRKYSKQLAGAGRERALALSMLDKREVFYRRLAERTPSQQVFLKGWLNRTAACRALVQKIAVQQGEDYGNHIR